jgi:flagellum-specific peptidoglycan hydrolase FlgJ
MAQIVHETDFFSSKVFKENNNLFGMKENRRGFCKGTKNGHAFYVSKEQSIKDYRAYQNWMLYVAAHNGKYPKTNEDYMALLEDLPQFWPRRYVRYATDPNYVASLRKRLAILNTL